MKIYIIYIVKQVICMVGVTEKEMKQVPTKCDTKPDFLGNPLKNFRGDFLGDPLNLACMIIDIGTQKIPVFFNIFM